MNIIFFWGGGVQTGGFVNFILLPERIMYIRIFIIYILIPAIGPLPVTGIGPLGNMPAVTGIGTFPALSPMGLLPPRLGGYPLLSPRAYYPGLLPPSFLPNPGLSMSQQPLIPPTPPPPFVGAASVMPRSPLVPPMHLQPRDGIGLVILVPTL